MVIGTFHAVLLYSRYSYAFLIECSTRDQEWNGKGVAPPATPSPLLADRQQIWPIRCYTSTNVPIRYLQYEANVLRARVNVDVVFIAFLVWILTHWELSISWIRQSHLVECQDECTTVPTYASSSSIAYLENIPAHCNKWLNVRICLQNRKT